MKTQFYLAPSVHADGEAPIRISVSVHGTRLLTTCGESVKPEFWDDAAKKAVFPKGRTNSHGLTDKQLNALLQKIGADFASYEAGLQGGYKPTIEELRDKLAESTGTNRKKVDSKREKAEKEAKAKAEELARLEAEKASKVVSDYFNDFVNEQQNKKEWSRSTIIKLQSFGKKLADFDSLVDLNSEDGINTFVGRLKTDNLANRTIEKNFRLLRWFLKWAERKGYIERMCLYEPTIKVVSRPVIYLTPKELMKLYSFQIPSNGTKVTLHTAEGVVYEKVVEDAGALEKTRDCFCFSAFTSLRYSDMANLRRSDISENSFCVTQQKTEKVVTVELNKFSRAILEKYKDCKFRGDLALPVISNQKMNQYLKDICELCEINEPISITSYRAGVKVKEVSPKYELIGTHAARRSFVVSALSMGIPPQVVMQWTGHSDYAAMKPYIGIVGKVKAEAMAKFDNMGE